MSKHRKRNSWIFDGSVCIGIVSDGTKFYIDKEDFDFVEKYTWYIQQKKKNDVYTGGKYVCSQFPVVGRKRNRKFIHNIIWENNFGKVPIGMVVDHIDRNPLNNIKDNLRLLTQHENVKNRSKQYNNTSGIVGVSYAKKCDKWYAYITNDNVRYGLGYYKNKTDAVGARLKEEFRLYGHNAPQKHLFKEYGIE